METRESGAFFSQESKMFDMQKVGERIAALRRKVNMTQADLAEQLGISYQAVSSWERGATMPDISKLVELSRVLGTTVDALLSGEESEAPAQVVEDKQAAVEEQEAVQEEETAESFSDLQERLKRMGMKLSDRLLKFANVQLQAAGDISCGRENGKPVITIKQKKKEGGSIRRETISAMASSMDQELLEDVLVDAINDGDEDIVEEIACYLEPETIDRAMERATEKLTTEMAEELAMYMGHGALEECAVQALNADDCELMEAVACHMDAEVIERALERCEKTLSSDMVEALACYASELALDLMLQKIDLDDEDTMEELSPYLNQRQMRELLKRLRNR